MPKVTFSEAFNFVPPEDRRCAVKYPAGYSGMVRQVCADMAIAAGKATLDVQPEQPQEKPDDVSGTDAGTGDLPAEDA